jgi:hypothetical protein
MYHLLDLNAVLIFRMPPYMQPMRRISIAQSSLRKKRDSILLDSSGSHSNLRSMLFTVRDSTGVTEICPESLEDKV